MVTGPALLTPGVGSSASVTEAVLLIVPQLAVPVTAVTVMSLASPRASVPQRQVRGVPPATAEVGEQAAASGPDTVQVSPAGSVSVRTTFVEFPVPPAVTLSW